MGVFPIKYRTDIDFYKGLAIIAIVLYHIGVLPLGYLGVEVFLVINGFLVIPRLFQSVVTKEFGLFDWIERRLLRLWPIVLLASVVSMIIGYFVMLPDSYENLAESVVASNLFANNILSFITGRSYWDSVNEYKPLMQMWYLGVVVQSYVTLICLIYIVRCYFAKKLNINILSYTLGFIAILSVVLYLFKEASVSEKFYLIQYRFWEFAIGGLVGLFYYKRHTISLKRYTYILGVSLLILLCCILYLEVLPLNGRDSVVIVGDDYTNIGSDETPIYTIVVVAITSVLLNCSFPFSSMVLCQIGKMSLSIFVWHQVILAFYRYSVGEIADFKILLCYLFITFIVSIGSYVAIEKRSFRTSRSKVILLSSVFLVSVLAFVIYLRAGVVRDVPELDISVNNPTYNRNTDYIDQVYSWSGPFESDNIHVLVVGNSFARDFACILKEYNQEGSIEIAYAPDFDNLDKDILYDADYMFSFGPKSKIPDKIINGLRQECQLYGIGTKSFGKDFGVFYSKRNTPEYYNQSIIMNEKCDSINRVWRSQWGEEFFIDIMEAAKLENGKIRLFTPDKKIISFDCRHLTPAACRFFAGKIDFDNIFNPKKLKYEDYEEKTK